MKSKSVHHKTSLRKTRKNGKQNKQEPENPTVIGLIYAKWCGHCQALEPEWNAMKQNLMKERMSYQIVEIEDSDPEKETKIENLNKTIHGGKLQANGYPTIFKKVGNKIEYYEGNRKASDMENWLLGKVGVSKKSWRNYLFGGFQSGTLHPKPTPHPKPQKPSEPSKPSKPSKTSRL